MQTVQTRQATRSGHGSKISTTTGGPPLPSGRTMSSMVCGILSNSRTGGYLSEQARGTEANRAVQVHELSPDFHKKTADVIASVGTTL